MAETQLNKILLLAFKFPPYAGVGGYRWSKLCKYLARMGHEIHVVTVRWKSGGANTFWDDVQHPNIHIHRIRAGFPINWKYQTGGGGRIKKFKYYLYKILNRLYFKKRFFDDEAQNWGKYCIPACENLIEAHQIGAVIATGAPFQTNRWAAALKKRNPQIKLIQDFRDPWADDSLRVYGNHTEKIRRWQEESVLAADAVVTVTQGLEKLYRVGEQDNCFIIPNGFDGSGFGDFTRQQKTQHDSGLTQNEKHNKIIFTHIGNLSAGREKPLTTFLDAVGRKTGLLEQMKILLIGGVPGIISEKYGHLIESGVLSIQGAVSQKEAWRIIQQSDFALQFNAQEYPYLVSTKIYEYAYLKVPVVSINYGGEIEELIAELDSGYSIHAGQNDIEKRVAEMIKAKKKFTFRNLDKYSYEKVAESYSKLINESTSR